MLTVVILIASTSMAWVGVGVLIAAALGLAMLIRLGRGPGAPVLGGLLAGLLLGPSILGAAFPAQYEAWFVGGAQQRRNLDIQRSAYDGALDATIPVERDEARLDALQEELDRVRAMHARPLAWVVNIIAFALLAFGGSRIRPLDAPHVLSAVSIGLWAALVPAGIAWLCLYFIWDQPAAMCSAIAAAIAIGPWLLSDDDQASADEAEVGGARLISAAGRIASLIAVALVSHALFPFTSVDQVISIWPLAGLGVAWLLSNRLPRRVTAATRFLAMAMLTGMLAVRIDLYSSLNVWMILLFAVLSGDGRWIGAWLGALALGGRTSLRTLRLVLGSMACSPTQLAAAAILLHGGLIEISPAAALLAGVLLIELFAPVRRRVAEQIRQTEVELDKLREEDES